MNQLLGNRRSCPYDERILEFYKDCFEAVFVAFHPFLRPISLDFEAFNPETYPEYNEILHGCEPVAWAEFLKLCHLKDTFQLDHGVRAILCAVSPSDENKILVEKICEAVVQHKIVYPSEGKLPPHLKVPLLRALKELGHERLLISDEFCEKTEEIPLETLMTSDLAQYAGHINTLNNDVLITTHWDSPCSYLCSSRETINSILANSNIEGFFCTQTTEVYWGLCP